MVEEYVCIFVCASVNFEWVDREAKEEETENRFCFCDERPNIQRVMKFNAQCLTLFMHT